jgi:hypothetical protein
MAHSPLPAAIAAILLLPTRFGWILLMLSRHLRPLPFFLPSPH